MRRWIKVAGITVASLVAAVVAVAVAGLPLYVFPPAAEVDRADLVYVIGPPTPARMELAAGLESEYGVGALLVSVSPEHRGFPPSSIAACAERIATCETPKPYSTKGEALMLTEYAADHTADETVVITFTPHVARTRYIFEKCYPGDVTVVGVDQRLSLGDWVYQYAYQSAAFVKAWLTPCA